ncbi:GNAT family N-acetyltransferase [Nanchangia anserum]|uniref:GNAT family N-acetyltransferase n=1 Tax=Nanchangia anserum TaxID=2692125 RepID=A0A8I0G829_9ACTO|nr:GNAT family N-acetyltransferase [Nanchangia anserum]MBD3688874.1 GNAT family N-acetyltransferase [Nanchangia anserum]QOX81141.1 GNAT family N-acetyltransferase [Nanchangia anserum]
MTTSLHVRPVDTADDMLAAFALRREVFVNEQSVPLDLEIDDTDFDPQTVHLIGELGDDVVAVGRLTPPEATVAADLAALHLPQFSADGFPTGTELPGSTAATSIHVGRLAVRHDKRGLGLGAALVAGCLREAARRWRGPGALMLELSAQVYAIGFYRRTGFALVEHRDTYLDAGIEHRDMAAMYTPGG